VGTPVLDVARPFIHGAARLYWRIRLEGTQHIPTAGPLIIAPNHVTFADPVLVCLPIRFAVHFMAWDALFKIPGFAWIIRRLRAFPTQIDSADPRSTREAVRLLQAGQALMIVYHPLLAPPDDPDPRVGARRFATQVREAIAASLPKEDRSEPGA